MGANDVMHAIAKALAVLVGIQLIACLALVAVNWNDEPPSADARRLVAVMQGRPAVAADENGYVHALELAAALIADPVAAVDHGTARSPEVTALAAACTTPAVCAEAMDADPAALVQWLDSERWLLDRYRRMLAVAAWREEIPHDVNASLLGYQHGCASGPMPAPTTARSSAGTRFLAGCTSTTGTGPTPALATSPQSVASSFH